ncbi:MAG: DUF1573 domain-containing protein [Ignavibacteriaceae bacterium]|nr:DUF1573 domain-containing protein [Ignavibacteriaceae bacterium]NUM71594.1 DUF1573 domain-containing protein [Ignavibacteriaceae bacterium]
MKSIGIFLFAILLSAVSLRAQNDAFSYVSIDKSEHDFGKVEANSKLECTFKIKNISVEPLVIRSIARGHSSVILSYEGEKIIMPGNSKTIKARLRAPGGPFSRRCVVEIGSNNGEFELSFFVKGNLSGN